MASINELELIDIVERLYKYENGVCYDNRGQIAAYRNLLPFKILRFRSGSEINKWVLPPAWKCVSATVTVPDGTVYDCLATSPLGCAFLSPSFEGQVSRQELLDHCSYREDLPEAVVYDWTRIYKPSKRGVWGLSIPSKDLTNFPEGPLDICIVTETQSSNMIVFEYYLRGDLEDEIIFNAHNCHPYQANDDTSGVAVLIKLFQKLSSKSRRRYSYRLLIAPELFGPIFWLDKIGDVARKIKQVVLVKSVGNQSSLRVQRCFRGNSYFEKILQALNIEKGCRIESFLPFRTYHGNDEIVFEAPGFEIPSTTISRFPFLHYHTHLDNIDNISVSSLRSTLDLIEKAIEYIEIDFTCYDIKEGLFCLSHPDLELYMSAEELGISDAGLSEESKKWNLLMNCLTRDLTDGLSISDLSLKYQLPFPMVAQYVEKWITKGLCFKDSKSILNR